MWSVRHGIAARGHMKEQSLRTQGADGQETTVFVIARIDDSVGVSVVVGDEDGVGMVEHVVVVFHMMAVLASNFAGRMHGCA